MNHHLESLGWTLVHFCWQAAAIALVYWLTDAVLRKARSQTRYVLALATMLLMLISALATFAYEETRGDAALSSSPAAFSSPAMAAIGSSISGLKTAGTATPPVLLPLSRFMPWLDVAWLLGVACLSTRTIGGWWLIHRLRRSMVLKAPEAVYANFVCLCERLGITRQVSLYISHHIQGPLTIGVVRSLVIVPASALMALTPEQLEAVLAHELAHVRRADYLWNLIQTMVETLLFFHPAVWWLGRRLREQRELCCDDVAVESCADPLVYATALLRLEERRGQRLNLAMALDGNRPWSGLSARIARILGETNGKKGPRELVPVPLAAICALFLLVLLPMPHLFAGLRKNMQPQIASPAVSAPLSFPSAPTAINLPEPVVSTVLKESSPIAPRVHVALLPPAADDQLLPPAAENQQAAGGDAAAHKADYIDRMRSAGYDVDIDKYIAMKVQGITPEYAQAMAKAGFGKPSADELIAMKVQGITPEYVSELHAAGLQPSTIGDLVSYRIFKVTPEFVTAMKAAGFDSIPPRQLVALRVHNVTPEYAKTVKQQYPNATIDELIQLRIFHIDDAFLAAAKRHGFSSLSIEKLVQLRISGVLGDADTEAK
jgi:beta-lactamase regulating signal transducer with metallopeptidase domain